jgi:hypothetical protein
VWLAAQIAHQPAGAAARRADTALFCLAHRLIATSTPSPTGVSVPVSCS